MSTLHKDTTVDLVELDMLDFDVTLGIDDYTHVMVKFIIELKL